jgi:hypothetical protein
MAFRTDTKLVLIVVVQYVAGVVTALCAQFTAIAAATSARVKHCDWPRAE